jgi:hypothetical protein
MKGAGNKVYPFANFHFNSELGGGQFISPRVSLS